MRCGGVELGRRRVVVAQVKRACEVPPAADPREAIAIVGIAAR
jgi:hypothetical protein